MGGYGISRWSDALFVAGSVGFKLRESMKKEKKKKAALGRYGRLMIKMLSWNAEKFSPIAINFWEGDGTLSWKL